MKNNIKKIIVTVMALAIIASMSITAYAVTPELNPPEIPSVPDISDDVHVELPDDYWDNYFEENPLPDDIVDKEDLIKIKWHSWVSNWCKWWHNITKNYHIKVN